MPSYLRVKKTASLLLILILLVSLTSCFKTTEVTETEETVIKVYEFEGESMEDIFAQMETIPDTIEINGKTYKKESASIAEEGAEEGTTSISTTYTVTDDPLILYGDVIIDYINRYYVYVLAAAAIIVMLAALLTVLKRRYINWW